MGDSDSPTHEVRALIEGWVAAVGRHDLDGVVARHADGVVMFDVPPPEDGVRGLDAYASTWPDFLRWVESGARFEIIELHVEAGVDVAFAWALLRCGTDDEFAAAPDRRLRLSFGLCRGKDGWEIHHEHHSFTHP